VDAIHAETCKVLNEEGLPAPSAAQLDFSKGNVKARTRMIAQYET
jgi:NAD+ synthase